MSVATCSLVVR